MQVRHQEPTETETLWMWATDKRSGVNNMDKYACADADMRPGVKSPVSNTNKKLNVYRVSSPAEEACVPAGRSAVRK